MEGIVLAVVREIAPGVVMVVVLAIVVAAALVVAGMLAMLTVVELVVGVVLVSAEGTALENVHKHVVGHAPNSVKNNVLSTAITDVRINVMTFVSDLAKPVVAMTAKVGAVMDVEAHAVIIVVSCVLV